jgi:hypothetical protein
MIPDPLPALKGGGSLIYSLTPVIWGIIESIQNQAQKTYKP